MVGHLSMYIQTETMSQSLIPTRGAACRREPLERARSNRRASRWTGSGRRHAGRVSQKRKPPLRAGRAGGGRVAHGGASSGVPGSQGMPQKRTSPGSFWKRYRRRPGNGVFWAAWFQNPNFAGAAPCASPGSFKGFMRTMPPVRWGAAMEVSFLPEAFVGAALRRKVRPRARLASPAQQVRTPGKQSSGLFSARTGRQAPGTVSASFDADG